MTNPMINPQPNYSGVTIQIANPAVYAGNTGGYNKNLCPSDYSRSDFCNNAQLPYSPYIGQNAYGGMEGQENGYGNVHNLVSTDNYKGYKSYKGLTNSVPEQQINKQQALPAYPPQYYLNNYNYQNNGLGNQENLEKLLSNLPKETTNNTPLALGENENFAKENANALRAPHAETPTVKMAKQYDIPEDEPQDFTKSQAVIDDLDARVAAEEAAKKNSKQKRIVALTDEYIKSLENYLNNPNDEIRLMASKEILTRLDEDKDRYNDAALNALLNKMLQDPSKLIRVASLSAFASQLASGNDYTVTLLQNIQSNPSADKEDVLQAADILLKMSAGTEVKNIPNPQIKETPNDSKG